MQDLTLHIFLLPPLSVTEKFPDQFSHRLDVVVFRQTRQHVLAALFGDLYLQEFEHVLGKIRAK